MNDRYTPFRVCEENTGIVLDEKDLRFAATYGNSKAERAECARRIVACMNALEHVSTEQLESGEFRHTIEDLTKQRDELLVVLERIAATKYTTVCTAGLPPLDQRAVWAEAALASVKGEANGPKAE